MAGPGRLDTSRRSGHAGVVAEISPLPKAGHVFIDSADPNHWLRISWHEDQRIFVLSTWSNGRCEASFQLGAAEAVQLMNTMMTSVIDPQAPDEAAAV
jgi:hypothetical protein